MKEQQKFLTCGEFMKQINTLIDEDPSRKNAEVDIMINENPHPALVYTVTRFDRYDAIEFGIGYLPRNGSDEMFLEEIAIIFDLLLTPLNEDLPVTTSIKAEITKIETFRNPESGNEAIRFYAESRKDK